MQPVGFAPGAALAGCAAGRRSDSPSPARRVKDARRGDAVIRRCSATYHLPVNHRFIPPDDASMTTRRPTLVLPTGGPALDPAQLAMLRTQFEVVEPTAPADALLRVVPDPASLIEPQELEKIDRIGQEFYSFDAEAIRSLNAAQRIKRLEERLIVALREVLHVEHFEVRLLHRETRQLELVMAVGIKPLGVGKSLYARPEHQGISGSVACMGASYLCRDARTDPRYMEGLEGAASALTVPLFVSGEVIGVLNMESRTPDAFTDADRVRAELLARSIAIALHLLQLLVVERYTTRKAAADTIREEIRADGDAILRLAAALRGNAALDAESRTVLDEIIRHAERVQSGADTCSAGPQTLLGVDRALRDGVPHPALGGRTMLVVDDDDGIRGDIGKVLTNAGVSVLAFDRGLTAVDAMKQVLAGGGRIDAVLSDVRLPDLNGYEIFRSARELFPSVPIILMTGFGYDPHHSIVRASQEGLQSILFKPFKAEQLIEEAVRAVGGATAG